MRCPIDNTELTPVEYEGALIQTCASCGGELVTADALGHIIRKREEVFGPDWKSLVSDHEPLRGVPDHESRRLFPCPVCDEPMATVNYAGDTQVIVDRCESCGAMWLDQHELEMAQVILEQWKDKAPERLRAIAGDIERARADAAAKASGAFAGSRFAFVNAVINRLMDAA
ncbi:MAG: zf-TFIIB domain-containing protein [Phycisphaerales bacterium JB039]